MVRGLVVTDPDDYCFAAGGTAAAGKQSADSAAVSASAAAQNLFLIKIFLSVLYFENLHHSYYINYGQGLPEKYWENVVKTIQI